MPESQQYDPQNEAPDDELFFNGEQRLVLHLLEFVGDFGLMRHFSLR